MTEMANRALRWAREDYRGADADERNHRRECVRCARAVRHRRPDERCQRGLQLLTWKAECARKLKEERELAKAPVPGQMELFNELA